MPPKNAGQSAKKKSQRVRVTHKALESRQFSTVRLPRTSEVPSQKADVRSMYDELGETDGAPTHTTQHHRVAQDHASAPIAPTASSSNFDPIVSDPMFTLVANSKYWPPPSLEALQAETGHDHGDGFDSYDRREDDKQARKERAKLVKGEINHPRGKPRQNIIVKLSDSSGSDRDAEEDEEA